MRLVRLSLADAAGWLDAGTTRLDFTLTNLVTNKTLTPICVSPACMFRRVRVIANGSAVIEDIAEYGRCYQVFSELLPPQRRFSNLAEAWGGPSTTVELTS
jgi:hypothetical protein